jgi:DNA-directed RNA polymerase specialized sigma subunit
VVTVQELQQLFYLEKLIEHEKERLEELRASAGLKSPLLSDMPKAPGARDKLGDLVPKIVDQEAEIAKSIKQYSETKERLLRYINHVPNARIKMIMILRFVDQKPWQEVADLLGGKETEYSVKKTIYRYVERMP